MDKNSVVGELFEKGQQTVSNSVTNTTSNTVSDISQTVVEQMGLKPKSQVSQTAQGGQNIPQSVQTDKRPLSGEESTATKEMVSEFYGPSDDNNNSNNNSQNSDQNSDQNSGLQIQARLADVRKQLADQHKDVYYDPLFSYENKKEEPRKADVMEQEEQAKMQELAVEKQKNNEDIAKTRAQIAVEANRGVAG